MDDAVRDLEVAALASEFITQQDRALAAGLKLVGFGLQPAGIYIGMELSIYAPAIPPLKLVPYHLEGLRPGGEYDQPGVQVISERIINGP